MPGVIGRQFIYPFATAEKLATLLQIPFPSKIEYIAAPGRNRVFEGIKNTTIIDDSYNSSPFAAMTSIENLKDIKLKVRNRPRIIVAFGDMLELSVKDKVKAHREVLDLALSRADEVVLVGDIFRSVAKGTGARCFKNSIDARDYLLTDCREGDIFLIKGSQSTRMEKIVEELVLDTVDKKKNRRDGKDT